MRGWILVAVLAAGPTLAGDVTLDAAARLSIVATCALALIFAGPALPF